MTKQFDLIVLGAGSAGLTVAQRAARHGARVALIDPGLMGGTCVNLGCVPKKAMWFAAQLAQAQVLAVDYGFDLAPGRLDWQRFRQLRDRYIEGIRQRYDRRLREVGVQVIGEAARFVAADTVETAQGTCCRAPQVVIATGASPRRLELPGFGLGMVSDDMFSLDAAPRRIAIVGGGYIATEFACLLRSLGAEVELLIRERLLDTFDAEMAQALCERMQAQGIRVARADVRGVRGAPGALLLDDATGAVHGRYDALLWAVGRVPNTRSLGLEEIGVALDPGGHVRVDAWQNTTVPGIAALGDVTARKALTPVAVAAGYALAERLFGGKADARFDYELVPSVVFAEPPLGMVGLGEAEARERHGDAVRVYTRRFTPLQLAVAGHAAPSLMKLVCHGDDDRVLGIHVLGPGADEMLQGFAVALRKGLTRHELRAAVAIHPTSAEELLLPR
ncbi:glutathione reductase [Frateuria sp. Soil773]|uniref:glutathione-disulfide reductase n=1 Tax=Frateuria sp. Soil773 TaxID=1736407 RepID=UPI0006F5F8E4|nr:glutathione-disulfide reductase [Frateuria sp. Soil773]KRE89595.1 glutathione reductase [Frateuria sp. Soil773]